ncbi:MAG: hypothetical protein K6B69_15655 [Lachnospiraceae bacterium]|nr:hypothetical protein [Lachnospiraceae bacterium]
MSDFHTLVKETKSRIWIFMEDKEGRPSYMSDQQLEAIVEELDKMDRIRDEKVFYPYYPKCIIDGWDYKDPLAKKLLDILDIYVRL